MLNIFKMYPDGVFFLFILISGVFALESTPRKQKAWRIHSYGDVKQLKLETTSVPVISSANQLLIQVKSTALNQLDLEMLGGYGKILFSLLRFYEPEFPLILGREFAGTVINKGHRISDDEFKEGDDVYGISPLGQQGCQAEFILADKAHVLLRPSHLSMIEAGSVLFTSITAWSALFLLGGLSIRNPAHTKILIIGASGGVGTVATQILKSQNATVVGVSSTDAVPLVTSLGADFAYDYKDPEYEDKVATHGVYDIIFDCANYSYDRVPKKWNYKMFISLNPPVVKNIDKLGLVNGLALSTRQLISANTDLIFNGKFLQWGVFLPVPNAFTFIDKVIKNKQLKPIIQQVFNFSEVPNAFTRLAAGHTRGKIVINLQ